AFRVHHIKPATAIATLLHAGGYRDVLRAQVIEQARRGGGGKGDVVQPVDRRRSRRQRQDLDELGGREVIARAARVFRILALHAAQVVHVEALGLDRVGRVG